MKLKQSPVVGQSEKSFKIYLFIEESIIISDAILRWEKSQMRYPDAYFSFKQQL